MSDKIKINIEGVSGISGTEIRPDSKDCIVNLSIQLILSSKDIEHYKNKKISVEDLKQILKKSI